VVTSSLLVLGGRADWHTTRSRAVKVVSSEVASYYRNVLDTTLLPFGTRVIWKGSHWACNPGHALLPTSNRKERPWSSRSIWGARRSRAPRSAPIIAAYLLSVWEPIAWKDASLNGAYSFTRRSPSICDLLQTPICDPLAERRWVLPGKPQGHMAL